MWKMNLLWKLGFTGIDAWLYLSYRGTFIFERIDSSEVWPNKLPLFIWAFEILRSLKTSSLGGSDDYYMGPQCYQPGDFLLLLYHCLPISPTLLGETHHREPLPDYLQTLSVVRRMKPENSNHYLQGPASLIQCYQAQDMLLLTSN